MYTASDVARIFETIAPRSLWSVRPATVARDDADLVGRHLPAGAAWMGACGEDGVEERRP